MLEKGSKESVCSSSTCSPMSIFLVYFLRFLGSGGKTMPVALSCPETGLVAHQLQLHWSWTMGPPSCDS